MAPSYDNLPEEDDFDESEIDFADLEDQYQERLDEGLDALVVVDGLPKVPEDSKSKLIKFVLRKLNSVGRVKDDGVFMPTGDDGQTEGFAFVEYNAPSEAIAAVKQLHGTPLDKRHTMAVNKLTDIDRFGKEGRIDEEYHEPEIEPFQEKEHLRSWLGDSDGRDQVAMFRGEKVGVFWNEKEDAPDPVVDRENWTESFIDWSPQGTFLASMHSQGVQLWGGKTWSRQKRFSHPGVNLIDFSPNEKYITTWSHRPLQVDENHPVPLLSLEEDGKNYIIWDIATGKPLRSFATIDVPSGTDAEGNPIKKKMQWPTFKWSADDNYVARMTEGQSIAVYELPSMKLLDKQTIKIEGVMDFGWAPATPKRADIKTYEQLFCYWTPELGSNPAKVGLMSIPSKEIVRTRNLFNVSDAKLHWQTDAAYVCVKVDRHSKSKKSLATNLEIFRIREKGVPVEVVDSIKDTVINFEWEPKGNRFVLITTGEIPAQGVAVPPKTAVSFFAPEKIKGGAVGNFRHIRTIDKKNSNAIYWSPKGRFVVVAAVNSQISCELDFWDLSFEKPKDDKDEKEKDLSANLQLMNTSEHYGVTDIQWDPTGRYVATVASAFRHRLENGYHLYDFRGQLLREEHIDAFKQMVWRPRPPTLLSKEEQAEIRKNLRNYSKGFDEQDLAKKNTANRQVVEARREMLQDWLRWRNECIEMLKEEGSIIELNNGRIPSEEDDGAEVIELIEEEVIEETVEVVG